LLAYEPIKRIARMNVSLQAALVGVRMLYEVLDSDHAIQQSAQARDLNIMAGEVALNDVSFSYVTGQPVLRNVTLVCPGGEVTALVGPSGSGKSTVLKLIERFYVPDSGMVRIDGQNLSDVAIATLRGNISWVSQDTFLFSDTIRNNIGIVRPGATDDEIEAAARAAFAHDFIMEQPQGYDTQIGENGGNLSGGQRQRISIARAFLKDAPILLLDEATSALDSESEQKIQQAFGQLMRDRTTIVIAHRLSTIRNARLIHVMADGRLIASGTHDELMSDPHGLYVHLNRLQHPDESNPS
jgi:ATP-binding cassette subfamily B protein